jgi:hypothetical protein
MSKQRIPRKALQRVYDMACEMSHSNEYMIGVDILSVSGPKGKNRSHGRQEDCFPVPNPAVTEALRVVKQFFNLRGTP